MLAVVQKRDKPGGPGFARGKPAQEFLGEYAKAFQILASDLRTASGRAEVAQAISTGNVASVVEVLPFYDNEDPFLREAWRRYESRTEDLIAAVMERSGGRELARLRLDMSFNLDNPYSREFLLRHVPELSGQISDESKDAIATVIRNGFDDHFPPAEMARSIREHIGLTQRDSGAVSNMRAALEEAGDLSATEIDKKVSAYSDKLIRGRAENIARTETITAENQGTWDSWRAARDEGLVLPESRRRWIAGLGDRTCPICEELMGAEVGMDEPFNSDVLGEDIEAPPAHPSCFPAGTIVAGPKAIGSTDRWFDGEVVELHFAGWSLTATKNHPILTAEGWVAAGLLHEGSHVISSGSRERPAAAIDPDNHQVPSGIEQVARSFVDAAGMPAMEMPTAAEDFHGDGAGSKVHIVRANRELRNRINASLKQPDAHNRLCFRHSAPTLLSRLGLRALNIKRHLRSAHGIMRRFAIPHVLGLASAGHHQPIGFGLTPNFDSGINEPKADRIPRYAEFQRKGVLGFPRHVKATDFANVWDAGIRFRSFGLNSLADRFLPFGMAPLGRRQRERIASAPDRNPIGRKPSSHGKAGDTERLGNGNDRLAAAIAEQYLGPDALNFRPYIAVVMRTATRGFSGHVYNLQTKDGWYTANNIIVHNCRCTIGLVTPR